MPAASFTKARRDSLNRPKRSTMTKPPRHDTRVGAAAGAEAPTALQLENASMSDIIDALADERVTATALTTGYLARIAAYDRAGPTLNSVREVNPDAVAIAGKRDGTRPSAKRPLAGVPILV